MLLTMLMPVRIVYVVLFSAQDQYGAHKRCERTKTFSVVLLSQSILSSLKMDTKLQVEPTDLAVQF